MTQKLSNFAISDSPKTVSFIPRISLLATLSLTIKQKPSTAGVGGVGGIVSAGEGGISNCGSSGDLNEISCLGLVGLGSEAFV